MSYFKFENFLFFLIFLVSIFLNAIGFYVIIKSEILDLLDTIKSNLQEIRDFTGRVGSRLEIFETRLEVLQNKFENSIKPPLKDTVLPVLEDENPSITPYDED